MTGILPNPPDDSPWSLSYGRDRKWLGSDRMREGQFESLYEQMKAMNEQSLFGPGPAGPTARTLSLTDNPQRNPALYPGAFGYPSVMDDPRSKTPDETFGAPRSYRPVEAPRASANHSGFSRQDQPALAGQVEPKPAILPFPKRPGSVFQ